MRVVAQPAGSGIGFRLDGAVTFPAHAEFVVDTRRATVLGAGGFTVSTVEHVLSALAGMQVDNAMLDVSGPEIPVLDGSAAPYADAIARTGRVAQGAVARHFTMAAPRAYRDGDALLVLLPAAAFAVRCSTSFPAPIGAGYFEATLDPATYRERVAAARTFGFLHEVEALLATRACPRRDARQRTRYSLTGGADDGAAHGGRTVAHKVLDLVGDLSLLGARPCFEAVAIKSGHRLHAQATRDLRAGAASGMAS